MIPEFKNAPASGCILSSTVVQDIVHSTIVPAFLPLHNQTALNNILKDEEQKKNEHFINFISVGTLMLSIVFGLPSIYESLSILRKTTWGILENNIPYITIENSSIILWLLLNFFIIIRLLFKK